MTQRKLDVVACVARGNTNREIARELGLKEQTVRNYLYSIFEELGVRNRVELTVYAIRHRLVAIRGLWV